MENDSTGPAGFQTPLPLGDPDGPDRVAQSITLLKEGGIPVCPGQQTQLYDHLRLIRQWNPVVSVVSLRDADRLEAIHLPDALSLAPRCLSLLYRRSIPLQRGRVLDIGSGGGFPAVPLAIVLPEVQFMLVERSEKKIGFLRKVKGALGLANITLRHGIFPDGVVGEHFDVITARAVETPHRILRNLPPFLQQGAVFLDQSGGRAGTDNFAFHVEHIEDAWSRTGLRRGSLRALSLPTESSSCST